MSTKTPQNLGYIHCNKEILVMYLTLNFATDNGGKPNQPNGGQLLKYFSKAFNHSARKYKMF